MPPSCVLLTADAVGGVWTYALYLARALAERGTRVHLAVLGPAPGSARRAAAAAVPDLCLHETGFALDWLAANPEELRDAAGGLAELAGQVGAELVQVNAPALIPGADWPVPVVAVAHSCVGTWWHAVRGGRPDRGLGWRIKATAEGLAAADAVIAPSRAFAGALRDYYGIDGIQAVLNGCPPAPAGPALRDAVAFSAGRLWDESKNFDALDAAAARLDLPLYVAGPDAAPGGGARAFPHLRPLGLLGALQMAAWHRRAGVFVSVSRYEPFGLAVLEAAQAATPLVLSDIPTFRELWHGAALFVDPQEPGSIAEAVARVAADSALAARLGATARLRAARYTLDRMCEGTMEVYGRALAPERPQSGVWSQRRIA